MNYAPVKLLLAVRQGAWQLVPEMFDAGIDLQAEGNRALKEAVLKRDIAMVVALLQYVNPNYGAKWQMASPLGCAVRAGDPELILLLMEAGASVSGISQRDWQYYYNEGNYIQEQKMKDVITFFKLMQYN